MRERVWIMLLVFGAVFSGAEEESQRRAADLEQLKRVLPASEAWQAWLEATGELPPDFSAMASIPALPDPLIVREGYPDAQRITSPVEWEAHRPALLQTLMQWILGTVPPAPDSVTATVLSESRAQGATLREVELRFGPGDAGSLSLELMIPDGQGPFPVFMTQHNHRAWALIALRRGYIACVYAGADSRDDTDSFLEAYPEYDWSRLMRRAWAAGRCIDYLETVPEADTQRVALTGHSRNGKQSLMASAIDPRIAVVISSSSGAGGVLPTRHYSEQHFGEGIENITRVFPEWFHPRWRFFVGREHKLPVDLHSLVALSAPRPCLLSIALNDNVESTWAMEQTYLAVKPVYGLYGKEQHLRIMLRPGGHETWPTVIERYMDWCDVHFGRGGPAFEERMIHPYDWESWADSHQEPGAPADLQAAIEALLGAMPPTADNPRSTYGLEPEHIEALLNRRSPGRGVVKKDLVFGDYINADVYLPEGAEDAEARLPVVLWLHPMNTSKGYVAAYRRGDHVHQTLARAGFAVFCFDFIGHGRRIEEVEGFYDRYPQWSLLGHMVRDARAALDTIAQLEYVDQARIIVAGYGPGALVGLHLGALDSRPSGFAFVAGPQPWRRPQAGTLNLDYWAKTTMLWPQAGHYTGREQAMPYDLPDLLGALAPRRVLVVTPELDWQVDLAAMKAAVDAAQRAYDDGGTLEHLVPEDYNNLAAPMQERLVQWLHEQLGDPGEDAQ
jgi:dienelactone hydrolase